MAQIAFRYDALVDEVIILLISFLLAPALLLFAVIMLVVLPRVHLKDRCAQCGYMRAGIEGAAACPECGHMHGVVVHASFRRVARSGLYSRRYIVVAHAVGAVASTTAVPAVIANADWFGLILLPVFGAATAVPGSMLSFIGACRVSTSACWALSIAGSLPGACLFGFMILEESRAVATPGDFVAIMAFGATLCVGLSAVVAALCGIFVAVVQLSRNGKLHRAVQARADDKC